MFFDEQLHDGIDNEDTKDAQDDEGEVAREVDGGPVGPGGVNPEQEEAHAQVVEPPHPHEPVHVVIHLLPGLGQPRPHNLFVVIFHLS